jgi:transposase-like protein
MRRAQRKFEKLSKEERIKLLRLAAQKVATRKQLAERFGVTLSALYAILKAEKNVV